MCLKVIINTFTVQYNTNSIYLGCSNFLKNIQIYVNDLNAILLGLIILKAMFL